MLLITFGNFTFNTDLYIVSTYCPLKFIENELKFEEEKTHYSLY